MATWLFALTVGTVVIVAAMIVWAVELKGKTDTVRRRLEAVEKVQRRGSPSLSVELIRDELLSDVPQIQTVLQRWSWPRRMREYVAQAGLKIKAAKLVLWSGILGLAGYVAVTRIFPNRYAGLAVGAFTFLLPLLCVVYMRRRRLKQFEKSFPEAIDLLGRAVRAGHAFSTGLEMVGDELPEPVAGEFRTTFEEQNFGLPLKDAVLNLTERVPLVDVRFFATALLIQKETGGNLAEILDKLSYVVRERFRILGEVRTRTAQGRMTGALLIALPPAVGVIMTLLNPDYGSLLFRDPLGPYMIGAAAGLQVLGSLLLWKIVSIAV